MALPPLPSPQIQSTSLLDLLIRVFAFGMLPLDTSSSVLKVRMATRTPFTPLPSHQTARISSLAVWTRLSRCGSSLHQEEDTRTLQRVDDASGLSRDIRYVRQAIYKILTNVQQDFVLSVALTPDGNWVLSGSKDRGVQFWDPRTGNTQLMLQGHKNSVISVAPSPSGGSFATGSGDMRARIWSYKPYP
jgi:WD40 repeat protein